MIEWLKWKWFNFRCNRGWGGQVHYKGGFYAQSRTMKFEPPDHKIILSKDYNPDTFCSPPSADGGVDE